MEVRQQECKECGLTILDINTEFVWVGKDLYCKSCLDKKKAIDAMDETASKISTQ